MVVMLMGLLMFLDRFEMIRHGLASEDWPTVAGVVRDFDTRMIGDVRSGGTWSFTVHYMYRVDGHEYSSDRLRFSRAIAERDTAEIQAMLERFEPGRTVTVYHHPQQHDLSVLEPGVDRSGWLGMLLAILLLILAVVFWIVPTRIVSSDSDSGNGGQGQT